MRAIARGIEQPVLQTKGHGGKLPRRRSGGAAFGARRRTAWDRGRLDPVPFRREAGCRCEEKEENALTSTAGLRRAFRKRTTVLFRRHDGVSQRRPYPLAHS